MIPHGPHDILLLVAGYLVGMTMGVWIAHPRGRRRP